jgi:hypothetical protein
MKSLSLVNLDLRIFGLRGCKKKLSTNFVSCLKYTSSVFFPNTGTVDYPLIISAFLRNYCNTRRENVEEQIDAGRKDSVMGTNPPLHPSREGTLENRNCSRNMVPSLEGQWGGLYWE